MATEQRPRYAAGLSIALAILTVPVSVVVLSSQLRLTPPGIGIVTPVGQAIEPFRSLNGYGLFSIMTTTRFEIVVEGSSDGETWLPYEFRYKPGETTRGLRWVAPHQPRVDWQMWFAALGRYDDNPWFDRFCRRLLDGSPSVVRLLERNPFPEKPPRFVRGVRYRYRFADAATRRREGVWWTRERLGLYSPELSAVPRHAKK